LRKEKNNSGESLNRSMFDKEKPMNKNWLVISICVGMMILAACTSSGSQQGGDLTGKVWALTELTGNPPIAGTGISAQFTADGKVSGSAGCNQYSGTYTISGSNITFPSPMALTMMMCEQAVMDQESAYLKALSEAKTYAVNGDQLTLTGGDGAQLAVYKAQSQDLAGSSWEVTAYNNGKQAVVGVLEGTALTASFNEDGTLSGNSGCNQYNGAYKINGDEITIGPLASTMMMCSDPADVMDQETQYLAALQSAAKYQIEGNVLQLRTKDDALAVMFNRK
jgi:heat shock protein HslJ